jgi:creatinine amidohydrolase
MFPDELEAAFEECPIAYLPYGLCEPHGPQNALGMDAIRAHSVLCLVAQELGGVVAPPEYWHCHELGVYGAWAHKRVGQARPWLTAVPPYVFFKNLCYHIRAVDALGFHGAILFSGHSGPHRLDIPVLLETLQPHVSARLYALIGAGALQSRFNDDKGMGGHAGRGETSLLWAVAPDCVDLSRLPAPDEPGPHFALGDYAGESDRRAGERMVADIVEHLVARGRDLLKEYAASKPRPVPLTFDGVEEIWEREVRPRLQDFASMQDGPEAPPKDSRWHANWRVPRRG